MMDYRYIEATLRIAERVREAEIDRLATLARRERAERRLPARGRFGLRPATSH